EVHVDAVPRCARRRRPRRRAGEHVDRVVGHAHAREERPHLRVDHLHCRLDLHPGHGSQHRDLRHRGRYHRDRVRDDKHGPQHDRHWRLHDRHWHLHDLRERSHPLVAERHALARVGLGHEHGDGAQPDKFERRRETGGRGRCVHIRATSASARRRRAGVHHHHRVVGRHDPDEPPGYLRRRLDVFPTHGDQHRVLGERPRRHQRPLHHRDHDAPQPLHLHLNYFHFVRDGPHPVDDAHPALREPHVHRHAVRHALQDEHLAQREQLERRRTAGREGARCGSRRGDGDCRCAGVA
ncbi:hypothetical protein GLOTRDRAFT_121179, partial [Gloeophyllum trabeum ATCC 11539]